MTNAFRAEFPPIEVLLATYNGERYLPTQIDSILAQSYPNVTILAADDGSKDGTVAILREYEQRYPGRFRVLDDLTSTGHPKRNFERLIRASDKHYVALSDQDDFWLPEKLAITMSAMQTAEQTFGAATPLLVFTDVELVDGEMHQIHPSFWQQQGIPGTQTDKLPRLLAQNIVTGCTSVLNRPLIDLSLPIPEKAYMHDWWFMLTAAIFGQLISLPVATVRYRQHENNAVGAAKKTEYGLIPKFRQHGERRKEWVVTERNAEALLERFGDRMPAEKQRIVEAYVRASTSPYRLVRVFTVLRYGFFRANRRMNLAMLWYLWDRDAAEREAQSAATK